MSENDKNLQIVHTTAQSKDLLVFSREGFTMPAGNCPPEQIERMLKEWLLHQRREKWIGIIKKVLTIVAFISTLCIFNFWNQMTGN